MAFIFETENFTVEAADKPHVTRTDGGHIRIRPKKPIVDRTELTPAQAKELVRLTMILGEALAKTMNEQGIDVARINYQDNGNWNPTFHINIYGRAESAKIQKYGDALNFPHRETGFYDGVETLTADDISKLQREIEVTSKKDKYNPKKW